MHRIAAALAAASLISCAADRQSRAASVDPTNPSAPVAMPAAVADPLAPAKLVPDDDEEKDEKNNPHEHHHHREGGAP
jgi:hypothetical protein